MKNTKMKNLLLVIMAIVLCVSSLSGCRNQEVTETTEGPEIQATFLQLLGFDSYDEVAGTGIALGKRFGSMGINTDEKYITQGTGSLMVSIQGDYTDPNAHPFMKLDFLNTTCATCDFSEFKNISFDVYNATDKELHIQAGITVGKADGNYISTVKQTYTLAPNSWTTCTYDFMKMAGFSIYDFTSVRYLTIEFLEHKQSREDLPNTLYIDNLIGNYFADGEKPEQMSFDFHDGLDFETSGQELVITGQGKPDNDAVIDLVKYAELDIPALEDGGEYALKLSHDTFRWPTFRMNFGEELPAGTKITFMAYGLVKGENLYNKSIFEFSASTGGSLGDATTEFPCDAWVPVDFTLKTAATYVDLFWNYDRAGFTGNEAYGEVYIDNIIAIAPVPPIEPEGDIHEGWDFEIEGNIAYFEGLKIEGAERNDAVIERVSYADVNIPALSGGGEYALKLSHETNYWPTFRINFGKTLPKGARITFMAYAQITSGTNNFNKSIFEFSTANGQFGGEATPEFPCDTWEELTITLPQAVDHIDLFWNYDRAQITSGTASAEVYIDNMIALAPEPVIDPVGDWYEGLDFEILGNIGYFTGLGTTPADKAMDATIERVSYAKLNIPALENGGDYAMRLSNTSFCWPVFRISFGQTLPAGTVISYDIYTEFDGWEAYDEVKAVTLEPTRETKENGDLVTDQYNQIAWVPCGSWQTRTITLTADCDYIDLFYNIGQATGDKEAASCIYLDNMVAIAPQPPVVPVGSWYEGIGFEVEKNDAFFTGLKIPGSEHNDAVIERVSYADLEIPALNNGGEYALKLSHGNFCWPTFRMSFGETMAAGTVVTFNIYTEFDGWEAYEEVKAVTLEPTGDTKANGDVVVDEYNQIAWVRCGNWQTMTMTLANACDHVDLFYNVGQANGDKETASCIYLDSLKAYDPSKAPEDTEPDSDVVISDGIDFENADHAQVITGANQAQDVTVERVSYADISVAVPARNGSYGIKLSHNSHGYPTFRLNFGKTLPAGTVITFDAYGDYEFEVAAGSYKYLKIELTADSKSKAESSDPSQVIWMLAENWTASNTITLTADCRYLDFFYNVAEVAGEGNEIASFVLLDNIKAAVPGEPEVTEPEVTEPDSDVVISDGIDFETADHAQVMSGAGEVQDVTVERVSYADISVAVPARNGSYGIKLSHNSHGYPTFRLNFGKTLPAGTVITFDAYGDYEFEVAAGSYKYLKIELTADSKSKAESSDPNQVIWMLAENWTASNTITLTADCRYLDFFYNVAEVAGEGSEIASYVLLDNIKAEIPVEPDTTEPDTTEPEATEPDSDVVITDGIDFENAAHAQLFTGIGDAQAATIERVSYSDTETAGPENAGAYALKLSHTTESWPHFRMNFGKTLPDGTTITFHAYGFYEGDATQWGSYMKVELTADAKNYAESSDPNQVIWMPIQNWTVSNTVTLTAECDHLDFMYNVADGAANQSSSWLLLDNIKAVVPDEPETTEPETTVPGEAVPSGDILAGLTFETAGNELFFVGSENGDSDATVERVSYADLGITALSDGGEYALKLSHSTNAYPTVRLNFGKTLAAGTTVTFSALAQTDGNAISLMLADYAWNQVAYLGAGEWRINFTWEQTLPADSDYIDLVWESRGATSVASAIIIDNIVAVEPSEPETTEPETTEPETTEPETTEPETTEPETQPGDAASITDGFGFENADQAQAITGTGADQDATIQRVSYADAGVSAPANGGSYAMKVSHSDHYWPTFRVNFGETLPAGTVITFDAYGNYDYAAAAGEYKYVKIELSADSKNYAETTDPNQVLWTLVETWNTGCTITLTAESDHVDLFYNVADGQHTAVASYLLLDNIKAVVPGEPETTVPETTEPETTEPETTEPETQPGDAASITDGFGFENADQAQAITGTGADQDATIQRVSYADAGVSAPANGGSYAMKVSHSDHYWPTFRVNFGETLPAGTVITFDAYGNYDYAAAAGEYKYVKIELSADSKNYAETTDPNQVLWTLVETWNTGCTITLTAESDHVDLFYNVADGQHTAVASYLLLDNIKAVVPGEPETTEPETTEPETTEPETQPGDAASITEGLGFETEGSESAIIGTGADQDATVERVSYANAGVTAPTENGSYALKVSHANNCWPSFRLSFGETLPAGTVITFDAYADYEYETTGNKYVKIELSADSKNYAQSSDPNQILWTLVETWRVGNTVTLTAACDHLDLFYNVADGSHGEVASWLLLDNIKAVLPGEPETTEPETTEPEGNVVITDGIDFETAAHAQLFTGIGDAQAATIERVSYSDTETAGPENAGAYALKLSHTTESWPHFRLNFGKTLPAGTTITFHAYGFYEGDATQWGSYMKVELTADAKNYAESSDPNQVIWMSIQNWTVSNTVTLTVECDHLDLMYNVADGAANQSSSWLLLDNIKAVEPTESETTEPETTVPETTEPETTEPETTEPETTEPEVEETVVTITFDDISKRTFLSTEQQVWVENGITVTNDKASASSDVNGQYYNPLRFYKNSTVTVDCPGMTKIVWDASGNTQAGYLKTSIEAAADSNVTVSVSGRIVTIEFAEPVDTFLVTCSAGQCRATSMEIYK